MPLPIRRSPILLSSTPQVSSSKSCSERDDPRHQTPTCTAGGNTASGLPLGGTVGSLLNATLGGTLTDSTGSVLKLNLLNGKGITNTTTLDSLGLGLLNLDVSALVNDTSCPGGGLLNANLNLAGICVGAQVVSPSGVANLCVEQNGKCCCSPGES